MSSSCAALIRRHNHLKSARRRAVVFPISRLRVHTRAAMDAMATTRMAESRCSKRFERSPSARLLVAPLLPRPLLSPIFFLSADVNSGCAGTRRWCVSAALPAAVHRALPLLSLVCLSSFTHHIHINLLFRSSSDDAHDQLAQCMQATEKTFGVRARDRPAAAGASIRDRSISQSGREVESNVIAGIV